MPTIALIDDDPDIIEANQMLLEANGFYVVSARTVDDAINLIHEHHPDLVILDVMMQEADDGFYLANRFRRSGYEFPIIMLTSLSRSVGMHLGETAMVTIQDFLEKPVPPTELLESIHTNLQHPHRQHLP